MLLPEDPLKQVLIISATEREVSAILTTLSPRQRTEVLLVATKVIKSMFQDKPHPDKGTGKMSFN